MRFEDSFYGGFKSEMDGLSKEAWIPQALALGARALPLLGRAAKAAVPAARTALGAAGRRLSPGPAISSAKNIASQAAGYAPSMLPQRQPQPQKSNVYV